MVVQIDLGEIYKIQVINFYDKCTECLNGSPSGKSQVEVNEKNVSIVRSKIPYFQMMSLKEEDKIEAHLCQLFVFLLCAFQPVFLSTSLGSIVEPAPAAHFLIHFNKMPIWEYLKNSSPLLFRGGGGNVE